MIGRCDDKVFLIRNVRPEFYGGGETYQLMLANEIQKYKFKTYIISSSKKLLEESKKMKIPCISAPFLKQQNWSGWRNIFLPIYFIWQIYLFFWYLCLFKKERPKVVNIQSRDDWIAATLAANLLKIRTLWTDHMDFRSWVLQNVDIKFKNLIGKLILIISKSVYKVIFISDYEYNSFLKNTKNFKLSNNLIVIKNGSIDKFSDFKEKKIFDQSICYVGRLEEYKGIKELISAYKDIQGEFPDSKLNIYGSGSLSDYCKKYQNSQISYHGFTNNPLLVINESNIFILPSHIEGLSLALIDAMMMKKAIIATDIDGNPEVIKHNKTGILIKVKNKESLKNSLRLLLSDKKLSKKLSDEARKYYDNNFNFSNITKNKILPLLEIP